MRVDSPIALALGCTSCIIHTRVEPYGAGDVLRRQFVQVTAPVVTILDCIEIGAPREQTDLAIRQALERGWTTMGELRERAASRGRRVRGVVERFGWRWSSGCGIDRTALHGSA